MHNRLRGTGKVCSRFLPPGDVSSREKGKNGVAKLYGFLWGRGIVVSMNPFEGEKGQEGRTAGRNLAS
jgi:hypothetical protein